LIGLPLANENERSETKHPALSVLDLSRIRFCLVEGGLLSVVNSAADCELVLGAA